MWVNFKMTQSWSRVSHILWLPGETKDQEAVLDDVSTSFWAYDPWRAKSALDVTPKDDHPQAEKVLGLIQATWSWTLSPVVSRLRWRTNSPGCPPNFRGWTRRLLLPITRPRAPKEWLKSLAEWPLKPTQVPQSLGLCPPLPRQTSHEVRSLDWTSHEPHFPWPDKPRATLSLTWQATNRGLLDRTNHKPCSLRHVKPWAALSLTRQATSCALPDRTSHEPCSLWPDRLGEVDPGPAAPTSQGLDQSTVVTLASPVALATPPTSVSLPFRAQGSPAATVSWQLFWKRWAGYDLNHYMNSL